jgi:hypothetical protein
VVALGLGRGVYGARRDQTMAALMGSSLILGGSQHAGVPTGGR